MLQPRDCGFRLRDALVCSLVQFMQAFDGAMQALDEKYHFLASPHQMVSYVSEEDKVSARCRCKPKSSEDIVH